MRNFILLLLTLLLFESTSVAGICVQTLNFLNFETTSNGLIFQKTEIDFFGTKYSGINILPLGEHPLNKFVSQVDIEGLEFVFSRSLLRGEAAKGAYSPKNNILFLPEAALLGDIGPIVKHELVHAMIWNKLRSGKPSLFSGIAYNNQPEFKKFKYGSGFGIDEIAATFFSLSYHTKDLRPMLEKASVSSSLTAYTDIVSSIENATIYLRRLHTMLTTIHWGLRDGKIENTRSVEELNFLSNIKGWKKITTPLITLIFPNSLSKIGIKKLTGFASESIPILLDAYSISDLITSPRRRNLNELINQFDTEIGKVKELFDNYFLNEKYLLDYTWLNL